jgi:flagellar basal body rod protein FlgB
VARALLFPVVETLAISPRIPPMLFGLIDRTTSAASLNAALDRSVERQRGIADRVAKASLQNSDGFSLEAKGAAAQAVATANPVNVQDEMVAQADEQLRFLATAKLLEKTYQSLRSAIKGQG